MALTSVARFPREARPPFFRSQDGLMRLFLIAIGILSLGAGATFAQVPATTPPILSPLRLHDSGVGDCMEMWDSGTHMTKQEWSRACKRVQIRLDNLNVDVITRVRKTPR
jgi:hypothetical protein